MYKHHWRSELSKDIFFTLRLSVCYFSFSANGNIKDTASFLLHWTSNSGVQVLLEKLLEKMEKRTRFPRETMPLHKLAWIHIINLFHQPLLSILVWNYGSINSFIVLSVCYSSCSKTLSKTLVILPLWKISFSSEKGSPSMWLQMRSWNVFSLFNGTSWKIFCLLLSPESPWGHPSRRVPAH